MHPPTKDHTTIGVDEPVINCNPDDDKTRQEFKDEADITKILHRFGVPQRTNPQFGDYDYNLDLQGAMSALTEANQALTRLPEPLRAKYGTLQALQAGILSGDFERDYAAHRDALRIQKEDDDYKARTAAFYRAAARRKELEDRAAFKEFRKKNQKATTESEPPEPEIFP